MGFIHWAAERGHLRVFDMVEPPLEEYLKHERHHDETLLIACRHGQDAVVEFLLAGRAFDFSNGRALVAACASGNAPVLERLLHAQEELPYKQIGLSPFELKNISPLMLYQAASNGHQNIVEILLAGDADAYVSDVSAGLTCLQVAAKDGHLDIVRALCTLPLLEIRRGRNMDAPHESTGMKALHQAAVTGHHEIVTVLLEHGSGCDDRNLLGETALIKASQHGQAIVVKVLLGAGADPLIRGGKYDGLDVDWENSSRRPIALHHAAANGHDNVIAVLPYSDLTCGLHEINVLHLGAINGHSNVVQALLSKGAGTESEDLRGMTAPHFASQNGHKQVVQLLLDRGCSVDWRTKNGKTALHLAAMAAKIETIKLLVSRGAAVTAKTSNRDTALHLAARHADADTIRALVESGVPLEGQHKQGETALNSAVYRKLLANVGAMIELGAEWIRDGAFLRTVDLNDCDILNILLRRLSTATAKERKEAAEAIDWQLKVNNNFWNKSAFQILRERSKEEEESLGSSHENRSTGPQVHWQDGWRSRGGFQIEMGCHWRSG